jgi:hypothetical protein
MVVRPELLRYQNFEVASDGKANISWNPMSGRLIGITMRVGDDNEVPDQREFPLMYARVTEGALFSSGSVPYRLMNNSIYVFDGGTSSRRYRAWYVVTPKPLAQSTVVATSETPEELTIGTPLDYNGGTATTYDYILTVSATGTYGSFSKDESFYKDSLLRLDSDGSSVVVEGITSTFDSSYLSGIAIPCRKVGGITGSPFISESAHDDQKVSVLPWFPEEFYEALCYLAATKFTKVDAALDQAPHLAQKLQEFMRYISLEDRITPKTVVNLGNVSTGMARDTRGGLVSFGRVG